LYRREEGIEKGSQNRYIGGMAGTYVVGHSYGPVTSHPVLCTL